MTDSEGAKLERNDQGPHVVALGGGHGLASTLRAIRQYAGRVTAVVSVADDGGSSGHIRRAVGIPAPGDLRRCLVALAEPESSWAQAFEHRFRAGDMQGHPLGNLIIAGLADLSGDFGLALDQAAALLGVTGRVLPATSSPVVLCAEISGRSVVGQVAVAEAAGRISAVSLSPPDPPVAPEVLDAIAGADQVVIGPGSLFTSVLAVCAVPAIRHALDRRRGGRVYVCNLRPQVPETASFDACDHLRAVLAHGIAVDVMVAHGAAGSRRPAEVPTVMAPVALADGSGHDPEALAAVLSRLATEANRRDRPQDWTPAARID